MNPTPQGGGLTEPRFMTRPRKEVHISDLRSTGQDTYGCVPVRSPVVRRHAGVAGDAAKAADRTSPRDMGEANVTATEPQGSEARSRRSAGAGVPVRHSGHVFVLSTDRKPLDPCPAAYARRLLRDGKAAVFRRFPFTILLKERTPALSRTSAHRLKLDPGSQTTGIAVLNGRMVVVAAELEHRGQAIRDSLRERRQVRRSRRSRKTVVQASQIRQPEKAGRLARAVSGQSGSHDHDLGRTSQKALPDHGRQCEACEIRHAEDGACGHLRR